MHAQKMPNFFVGAFFVRVVEPGVVATRFFFGAERLATTLAAGLAARLAAGLTALRFVGVEVAIRGDERGASDPGDLRA